ncbi:MAG TPA: CDP-diacylglycerol--serine O-phosphatidyltransferase [Candidatus Saccharimonadia bacterium]|nr:CDP-diacylglycerol--serine O-phosphatidyltransferase [Candidatus Saccharimonadia bacterium]
MSTEPPAPPAARRRGVYLLPNLFTTGGLFAGFYAIVAGINGRFDDAAIAVFVAGLLDGIDGRVARLTNTQTDFGMQYDSLADLVSFGLAPALVMYTWALSGLASFGPVWAKVGWSAAFLYAACAALRLARFNTMVGTTDKRYFIGLASPAAAGLMMSFVWAAIEAGVQPYDAMYLALGITVVAGLLMVSRVRYWSFKAAPVSERVPFLWVPVLVVIFVLLAIDTPRVLFGIAVIYVLSGPILLLAARGRTPRPPAIAE